MNINRRHFLGLLGTGLSAASMISTGWGYNSDMTLCELFFSAYGDEEGRYGVAAIDTAGEVRFAIPLPGRAHAIAIHPETAHCVVMARRPGTFAVVLDSGSGVQQRMLTSAAGRHFYGHGVFSADHRLFLTTENDYESGRGVIGVRSVAEHYRQIDEWPSYGIGPHQLLLSADGNSLIVANGGILTHPDSGRTQLNPDSMLPSLVRIDSRSGALLDQVVLESRLHNLSIRHIAQTTAGAVLFGMQNQGAPDPALPLAGTWDTDAAVRLYDTPAELTRGYIGSVAIDHSGRIGATSAPRDGYVAFWDLPAQRLIGTLELADGCGLAATCQARRFRVSSGTGEIHTVTIGDDRQRIVSQSLISSTIYQWDNHLS
jgi:hypothetical protein